MEKRDKWEEVIRAKLEHFETKPDPGDWILRARSEGLYPV